MPYLAVFLLGSLAVLQAALAPRLQLAGAHPNLVLVAVVSWGMVAGRRQAMLWAIVGGLFLDLLSALPFGAHVLALLGPSLLTGLAEPAVFATGVTLPALVVGGSTLLVHLVLMLLLQATGTAVPWWGTLRHLTLPTLLVNMLLAPVIYIAMRRLHRRTTRPDSLYA